MGVFDSFKGIKDENFSLISLIMFIIAFFGLIWLTLQEIRAGQFYFFLIVGFMSVIFFSFLFIKEDTKALGLTFPVSKNSVVGSIRYWLGFILPILLALIFGFKRWVESKVIAPFMFFDIAGKSSGQTFAALSAARDPFFKFFTMSWVAGTIEEIIIGFEVVLLGIIIGIFIIKNSNIDLKSAFGRFIVYGIAFVLSILFFTMIHHFNPQYNTVAEFAIAAGFRTLMNLLMFFVLGIEFTIGFHQSNNLIAIGITALLAGIFTFPGIFIFIFWLIIAIIAVNGIMKNRVTFKEIFTMK